MFEVLVARENWIGRGSDFLTTAISQRVILKCIAENLCVFTVALANHSRKPFIVEVAVGA
jgi:hypothetical protein